MKLRLTMRPLRWFLTVMLVGIAASAGVTLLLPGLTWEHEPVHSAIEAIGSVSAIVLALLLLLSGNRHCSRSQHIWIPCALIGMGLLDGFHAMAHPGDVFVWLRSLATIVGGSIAALVWLPDRAAKPPLSLVAPSAVGGIACLIGGLSFAFPMLVPAMTSHGTFTDAAKAINFLGGAGFLLAAIRLSWDARVDQRSAESALSSLCVLFGLAALWFPFSHLWNADWWFWHLLRLTAYGVALGIVAVQYQQAQIALRQINAYNRSLIEASLDPLVTIGPAGRLTDVNVATEAATGRLRTELIGTDFSDYFTEPERARAAYQRVFREGMVRDYPLEIRHKDSRLTPVLYNASLYRDEAGHVVGAFAAARDITERKRAEDALRRLMAELEQRVIDRTAQLEAEVAERKRAAEEVRLTKERFRSLVETVGDWIWEVDQEGRYTYASPRVKDLLGYEPADLIGKTPFELMAPDDVERVAAVFQAQLSAHAPLTGIENVNLHKDGRRIVLETSGTPVFDGQGQFLGYRGVDRDITERKRAEEALRSANDALRAIIQAAPLGVVVLDCEGLVQTWNPASERIFGWGEQEVLGRPLPFVPPDKQAEHRALRARVLRNEAFSNVEVVRRKKDGSPVEISLSTAPLHDADGNISGILGIMADITERKRIEQALLASQTKLKAIFDAATEVAIIATEPEGLITAFNSGAEKMLGYSAEEMVGKQTPAVLHLESEMAACGKELTEKLGRPIRGFDAFVEHARREGAEEREWTYVRKNGTHLTVRLAVTALRDQGGGIAGFLGVASDITERKRDQRKLEEQLRLKAFAADVGANLATSATIQDGLCACAETMVRDLGAAFARIWTLDPNQNVLLLQASAGMYTNIQGAHYRIPVGRCEIGLIAQERQPHLTNQVIGDPRVRDQEWAKREGMVAFAGYPLLLEGRALGVMAMFARKPISADTLQAMQTVTHGIAQFIERRRAEGALQESEQRFRAIVETSPDGIFINRTSVDQIIYINSGGLRLLGATNPDQILGKSVFQFLHPAFHAIVRDRIKRFSDLHTPAPMLEEKYVRLDGTPIDVEVTAVPLLYQGEKMVFVVIRDITARKEVEARSRTLERLAALGQLLGGIAHELKNPLFILTGYLQIMKEKLAQRAYEDLPADWQKMQDIAERLTAIAERFLHLAAPIAVQQERCSVPALLQETLDLVRGELTKNRISMSASYAPDLPETWLAPEQVREVFLNLILNAVQAMTEAHGQGTLTVSAQLVTDTGTRGLGDMGKEERHGDTGTRRRGDTEVAVSDSVAASPRLPVSASGGVGHGDTETRRQGDGEQWIEVRIQDDGPGIPFEFRAKIFEPFYTTKPPDKGTGLGLWVVRSNLMMLRGTVWVESETGRGATFIVRLPVATELPRPTDPPPSGRLDEA